MFLAEQARINVERLKDLAGEAGLVAVVRFPIEFSLELSKFLAEHLRLELLRLDEVNFSGECGLA